MILDEATSNLDQETESTLLDVLEHVMDEMTVVIVAHRLNTTQSSDIIYVLDEGRIIGRGTHSEIVDVDGTLKDEFSRQKTM